MAEDDPMEIVKKAIQDNAIATEVNSDGKIVSWSVTYGVLSEATKQKLEAVTSPLRKARKRTNPPKVDFAVEFWLSKKDSETQQLKATELIRPDNSEYEILYFERHADVIVKWIEENP
ncbi:hypothetical protein DFH06DRAFT_1467001 [Mycena polygramma]|nr:hypothetical protein DFH06DRAFT_1467001 [Mycena polygramma]